ncbi:MAG: cyanophycin synthetase, partial [Pseudomonadota bacterium]
PNDTVPECDILEERQIYNVLRTQVDVVLPQGFAVLNGDDPLVAEMAELCDGEVIFFSRYGMNETVQKHLEAGGKAIFTDDTHIVLAEGTERHVLMPIKNIPVLQASTKQHTLEYVLAAIGAGWSMNLSKEVMAAGLQTYQ